MKKFNILFYILLITLFAGCLEEKKSNAKSCITCNMKINSTSPFTTSLKLGDKTEHFDDIGCMILYINTHNIDVNSIKSTVMTMDTNKTLDAKAAYYKIDEQTPMHYGFAAYEHKSHEKISFDEVYIKMLRGEHMANPKIRNRLVGDKN